MSEPFDSAATPPSQVNRYDDGQEVYSVADVIGFVGRHYRLLVGAPIVAGALGVAGSYLITPTFTSTTTMLLPQQQQSVATMLAGQLGGLAGGLGGLGGLKSPSDQWVAMLKSRTIGDVLLDRFKLVERYEVKFRFQALEELARRTTIAGGKDGVISVSVDDEDPKTAALMAAAYPSELQKLSAGLALTEAGQRRLFFEQQLRSAKESLTKAEAELQNSGVGEGTLKMTPEAAVEVLARLKAETVALEVRLPVMRSYLAGGSHELRQAEAELASLRRQLAKSEETSRSSKTDTAYGARFREFKYNETLYELMARQYEIARVDEARDGAVIQVIDAAQVPEWKSKPRRALFAGGAALVGLMSALMYLLARGPRRSAGDR